MEYKKIFFSLLLFNFILYSMGTSPAFALRPPNNYAFSMDKEAIIDLVALKGYFKKALLKIDPRIVSLDLEVVAPSANIHKIALWKGRVAQSVPLFLSSINEAAVKQIPNIGIGKGISDPQEFREKKKKVDGDATQGFEKFLSVHKGLIQVFAGEGEAEELPGLYVGQLIGVDNADTEPSLYGVFDPVDGTALVAKDIKGYKNDLTTRGALSLGALCSKFSSLNVFGFPDLQAYSIIVPENVATEEMNFDQPIEENLESNLRKIAKALGKKVSDLHVVTHSCDTGGYHQTLINKLKELGVRKITVPDPVTIETYDIMADLPFWEFCETMEHRR